MYSKKHWITTSRLLILSGQRSFTFDVQCVMIRESHYRLPKTMEKTRACIFTSSLLVEGARISRYQRVNVPGRVVETRSRIVHYMYVRVSSSSRRNLKAMRANERMYIYACGGPELKGCVVTYRTQYKLPPFPALSGRLIDLTVARDLR